MIFQCVCKGSLYKIPSFCALQTVIVQSRNSYLHTVTYACSNCTDAVNMNNVSETAEALCIGFTFHASSTNVFKHASICYFC